MAKVCRRTGKVNYRSRAEAERALSRAVVSRSMVRRYGKVERAAYRCPLCPYWHLTSQRQGS